HQRDVDTLLSTVRIASPDKYAAVEHLKKLSDAIRSDDRAKLRCAFYAANIEYRALANGKSQPQRDKEFAPVLAAANAYVAKFPTADVLHDVMIVVCSDESARFQGSLLAEEQQGLLKRGFFVAAMGRLSEQERKDVLTKQYAASFADTPQWMALAAKYPTAFHGCPQIDSFPFDMRCKTVAEYKRLAAAFEGTNSWKAGMIRAMALGGDFQGCINHFVTRESWNLDNYNQPYSAVTRDLWTSFSSLERKEEDKLPGDYHNLAMLKFGADHVVKTPLALDPTTMGDYLRRVWASLSGEQSDPAPMAASLDSIAWVPFDENGRKTAFEQVYAQFVAWTSSTRQRETSRKKELADAQKASKLSTDTIAKLKQDLAKTNPQTDKNTFDSLKKQLADAEKATAQLKTNLTTATERLAMVTKQVGQISALEAAFKRVMNPRSPGAGKAPNALCEALAQTVKAVQAKDQRALLAGARKLYPMVKDYDTRKVVLGRAIYRFLFSFPQEIDVFDFQLEALADQLSRFDPKSKTAELRLRTIADPIFSNPKWKDGFLAEDKDKALALNAVCAKAVAAQISRGSISPLVFDYVRRTRRGTGWGTTPEEIELNQDLVEQMILKNVLAQSKWRPNGIFATTNYMSLVRNEFTGLKEKYPPETYFDAMFLKEAAAEGYVDDGYFSNDGRDTDRKIRNFAAKIVGDARAVPVDGLESKPPCTQAQFYLMQNRAMDAEPAVRDQMLAKIDTYYGKTRFDSFAMESWQFTHIGNPKDPEVRKELFARLSSYLDRAAASNLRPGCPSLAWLGQLDGAVPLTDAELDVLLKACSPKVGANVDATLAAQLVPGLIATDRRRDLFAIAPYLWKAGVSNDPVQRMLVDMVADFQHEGRYDLEAVYSGVGLDLFELQLRESNQDRLRIARAQALIKVDGMTPVDRSDPNYAILAAQSDFLSGNFQRAWQSYLQNQKLALDAVQQLEPSFCVWLIRRNTDLAEFDVAEELARGALQWMESEPDHFSTESRARLLLAYANIALRRPEYPRARALFGRIAVAEEFAGTRAAVMAELQIAEVDRITKHYGEAIDRLEKLLRRKDNFAQREGHYYLATVLFDQQQYVESLAEIEKVFTYDPTHADARIFEGRINLQIKRLERASRIKVGFSTDQEYIIPGKPLRIGLQDQTLAVAGDTSAIEMRVWTDSGDEELFNLVPFADSRTQFEGQIDTALAAVEQGDHTLQVLGKDRVHYDFSDDFKKAHNISEAVGHWLVVISDADLYVSSGKILSKSEMEEQAMRRMLVARLNMADDGSQQVALGEYRPRNQIKPGNPINVRVVDADQSLTDGADNVTVTLATTSGDRVTFELNETATHSGVYDGAVPTASASATAFASDSEPGSQPAFAISAGDHPAWTAMPDDKRPKTFSIDLNASEKLATMKIDAAVPGRKLKQFLLQTSIDGKQFETVGSWPSKEDVWDGAPRVVRMIAADGDRASFAVGDNASVAAMQQALSVAAPNQKTIATLATLMPAIKSSNAPEIAHVSAAFHLPTRQMTTLQLKPKTAKGTAKYVVLVDGRQAQALEPDDPADATVQFKDVLGQGVHRIDVYISLDRNSTTEFALSHNTDKPPYIEPCPVEMFDPEKNDMIAKHFAGMAVEIAAAVDGGSFDVTFGSAVRARVVRLLLADFETDAPAIGKIHLTAQDGRQLLPSKVDLLALKTNQVLEIVPGDKVSVVYKDPRPISDEKRVREAFLSATYANATLDAALLTGYEEDAEGMRQPTYTPLRRFKPEDAICVVINDADSDTSANLDTVTFTARTGDGEPVELQALETTDHSGVFIGKIFVVEGAPQRKSEIRVAEGEDLVFSYLDEENTDPGIPWERSATIESVVYVEPQFRVFDTTSTPLPADEIAQEMAIKAGGEYVPATRTLAAVRPETPAASGTGVSPVGSQSQTPNAIMGAPTVCELVWPTIVQTAASTAEIYVQTTSGRKAYGKAPEGPFDVNVPGTIKIVAQPGNATAAAAPPGYRNFVVVGDPNAMGAMDDGRFMFTVPVRLGPIPTKSYATVPPAAGDAEEAIAEAVDEEEEETGALVVRGGDEIFIGLKYVDDKDQTQWITRKVTLGRDPFFNVMDREYREHVAGVYVGDSGYFRVIDPAKDLSDERDRVSVDVTAASGAERSVELVETFEHSGVFKGPVKFAYAEADSVADLHGAIGVTYGQQVTAAYNPGEELDAVACEIEIFKGSDGDVQPFTKRFADPLMAVRTRLTVAEAYFELAKKHRRMKQVELTKMEIATGKRLLEEALRDYPDTEARAQVDYLLANLALEFAEEAEEEAVKKKYFLEALSRFASIVSTYRDSTYAPKAQYKKALTLERMGQIDRACEEYVKLSYRWPDDPLIAETIARLGQYFLRKGLGLTAAADEGTKAGSAQAEEADTMEDKPAAEKALAESREKLIAAEKARMEAKESYLTAAKVFGRLSVRFPTHRLAEKTTAASAQCYLRAGEYDEAVVVFRSVAANERADNELRAESLYWAADCQMRKVAAPGSRKDAEKCLKEAYLLFKELTLRYPESKWARYGRGRLAGEDLAAFDLVTEESE
ncbi:MAG: hypothetical protein HQ567_04080, partial [Candidatus Nealsonbacteria bacterium]|nr:hypothetical protein [Candidatus Nealsonbacteria bacterium]